MSLVGVSLRAFVSIVTSRNGDVAERPAPPILPRAK
jgi:hypothetical protein